MSRSTLTLALSPIMLLALCLATMAHAGEVLGPQKSSQLVQLLGVFGTSAVCPNLSDTKLVDERLLPDGSNQSGFTIPNGKVLIITEVRFFAHSTASHNVIFALNRETATTHNIIATAIGILDADGDIDTRVIIVGGTPVKSGTSVCFSAADLTTSTTVTNSSTLVYGYLTKDE